MSLKTRLTKLEEQRPSGEDTTFTEPIDPKEAAAVYKQICGEKSKNFDSPIKSKDPNKAAKEYLQYINKGGNK